MSARVEKWTPETGFYEAERRIANALELGSEQLDLGGLQLKSLPETIYELTWLKRLFLGSSAQQRAKIGFLSREHPDSSECNILKYLPERFGEAFCGLKELDLGFNKLGVDAVRTLGELTTLTSLDLANQQFGSEGTQFLTKLTRLRSLKLMRTQVQRAINAAEAKDVAIGAAGAQTLSGLTSLTKLNLSNEELGDEGVQALSELPALRLLNLDRNEFGPLGMKALSRLTLLTSLDIGRNSIRDEGALALADLEKLTWLCIAENRIGSEGAKALANLNKLTSLNLADNRIGSDGAQALANLTKLTSLDLQNNNIGPECAPALSGLTALTSLNLAGNRIGTFGIKAFSELTNLRFLNLKGNGIGPIGAGALGSLTSLTVLLLQEDNPIGDEGVRALANLKALTELDLDGSEITDLRPLVGLPELEVFALTGCHLSKPSPQFWLKPSLRKINISDVSIPGVPEEILNGMAGPVQAALLAHFRDQERGGSTPLLEIKLMLLGNGRVGKTQIRNRLCDQDFEAKSDSTHGVNLAVVPLAPHSETATFSSGTSFADVDESSFKLKIWDFGGQEIYLGTHALFLRSRAIFSVVWAEGMNDGNHLYADIESQNFPLEYWVHYVASMGGLSSPLLIIRTRADEHTRDPIFPPLDQGLLEPFRHRAILNYSAKEKRGHSELLSALKAAADFVREDQGAVVIGLGRAAIKVELERRLMAAQKSAEIGEEVLREHRWISIDEFETLCREIGEPAGGITSPRLLLEYLHQIGVVFYDEQLFEGRIVIDQQWALDAIYSVFDRNSGLFKRLRDRQRGVFTLSDLADGLWDRMGYSNSAQEMFLSMMRSCGICFTLETAPSVHSETRWVAPDLLPDKAVFDVGADRIDDRRSFEGAQFKYEFLPPVLLRALMAAVGEKAGLAAEYWRGGFSMYDKNTKSRATIKQVEAPIEAHPYAGEISVRTQGGDAVTLLNHLCRLIEGQNDLMGLAPYTVKGPTLRFDPSGDPIDNLELVQSRSEAPEYFVSYAWGSTDETASSEECARDKEVTRLCKEAKNREIEIKRDTEEMVLGDRISKFMQRLVEGDLIFVILSAKYLQSAYCMYELFKIWERCGRREQQFLNTIRVIRLPDADLSIQGRLDCARYWQNTYECMKEEAGTDWDLLSAADLEEIKLMKYFANEVGEILSLIADTLTYTYVEALCSLTSLDNLR